MKKEGIFIVVLGILLVFPVMNITAAEKTHEGHGQAIHTHPDHSKMKNPVKADAKSIARGKKIYEERCAICHGVSGKGDGPAGKALNPPPADFTDNVWKHGSSDGEIFMVITEGVKNTGMSSFKDVKEEDRWHLVNYIKTFSKKKKK